MKCFENILSSVDFLIAFTKKRSPGLHFVRANEVNAKASPGLHLAKLY